MKTNTDKTKVTNHSGNDSNKRQDFPPILPENPKRIAFGKRFNAYRKMKGLSYSELATLAKVPIWKIIELCHGVFRDDDLMFPIYHALFEEYGLNLNWMIFDIKSYELEGHDFEDIPMIKNYVESRLNRMRSRICLQIRSFIENQELADRILDSIQKIK